MTDDNQTRQLAYRIRPFLNTGAAALRPEIKDRLRRAREFALDHHRETVGALAVAGVGRVAGETLLQHARTFAAMLALVLGAVGAYYWNNFQQADENEEIDSALLADDLPINAYLDQGFHAWLERSAPSSPQQ